MNNKSIKEYIENSKNESLKNCGIYNLSDLITFLNINKINEVIITLNSKESSEIIEIISNLRNLDVCINIVKNV